MAKKEISYRGIGQNVILNIEGNQYSRKVAEKSERENIKKMVEDYNKKNNAKTVKDLINFMTIDTKERKKEIEQAKAKKEVIEKPKVAKKKVTKEVQEQAKVEQKQAKAYVPQTGTRRSGEW